ncbi:hypothetical protein L6164_018506 [Bauhinia variegata]|uniref:Uncharacterized protein n=1 Tax=Bauhinia variegata TaxID=167791 RepID=A0ACB9NEU9_BAUVA|nr:hypothetical protein L6164_018506 [Bauhinia variegata]
MSSNSMDFTSPVPAPSREKEGNIFKELHGIFNKFFKWLLAIIAFKSTDMGAALFNTHPKLINASVLAIVLYFLAWIFGTTLQSHIRSFLPILTCIIVLLASAASISALLIISPLIALLSSPLWVAVFAVIGNCCYQQLCEMICFAIFETIKNMIVSYKAKSTKLPI